MLNGHGRGDLYVEVKVQTPSKLSKRQRELLQELQTHDLGREQAGQPLAAEQGEGDLSVAKHLALRLSLFGFSSRAASIDCRRIRC